MMNLTLAESAHRAVLWLVPASFVRLRVTLSAWLTRSCPQGTLAHGHLFVVRGYLSPWARRVRCEACGLHVRQTLLPSGRGRAFGWGEAGWYADEWSASCDAMRADKRFAENLQRPMEFPNMVTLPW